MGTPILRDSRIDLLRAGKSPPRAIPADVDQSSTESLKLPAGPSAASHGRGSRSSSDGRASGADSEGRASASGTGELGLSDTKNTLQSLLSDVRGKKKEKKTYLEQIIETIDSDEERAVGDVSWVDQMALNMPDPEDGKVEEEVEVPKKFRHLVGRSLPHLPLPNK